MTTLNCHASDLKYGAILGSTNNLVIITLQTAVVAIIWYWNRLAKTMEQQKSKTKNPYQDESIEDVLLFLSYGDQYPNEYQAAFLEIHRRYIGFINKICHQVCKFFSNSEELAADLAGNVLLYVCQNAIQFEAGKGLTKVEMDKIFKEWLVIIAKGELKRFTSHNPERKNYSSLEGISSEATTSREDLNEVGLLTQEIDTFPITNESVVQALESLKPKERDIIMAYLTHVHRKNAHLPDEIMAELCSKYGTTSFNVRKIKQRAFDKIRKLNEGKA